MWQLSGPASRALTAPAKKRLSHRASPWEKPNWHPAAPAPGRNHHSYRRLHQGTSPQWFLQTLWPASTFACSSLQTFHDSTVQSVVERDDTLLPRDHTVLAAEEAAEDSYQCREEATEDPFQHSGCLVQILAKTEESLSDPAVGAAPPALFMFVLQAWSLTCHLCYTVAYRETEGSTLTSTRLCRRIGLALPETLTGNSELNILVLIKGVQGRRAPLCKVIPLCPNMLALPPNIPMFTQYIPHFPYIQTSPQW